MTQTNVSIAFAPGAGAGGFRLQYVAEDNILPSKVEGALDALAAQLQADGQAYIRQHPTLWGMHSSKAIADAVKEASRDPKIRAGEQLYLQDVAAWPVRRLRLYQAGNAFATCNYGSVIMRNSVTSVISEQLVFTGSDNAALDYIGQGASISAVGRVYDTSGDLMTSLRLTYADGKVMSPMPIYGIVDVSYSATYRVVELTVTPTGSDFEVLVAAFKSGEHTSATVSFEVLEFDPAEEQAWVGGGTTSAITDWPDARSALDDMLTKHEDLLEQLNAKVWSEVTRTMSTVDVDGVAIQRIEDVTFMTPEGGAVTLVFNNSGVQ